MYNTGRWCLPTPNLLINGNSNNEKANNVVVQKKHAEDSYQKLMERNGFSIEEESHEVVHKPAPQPQHHENSYYVKLMERNGFSIEEASDNNNSNSSSICEASFEIKPKSKKPSPPTITRCSNSNSSSSIVVCELEETETPTSELQVIQPQLQLQLPPKSCQQLDLTTEEECTTTATTTYLTACSSVVPPHHPHLICPVITGQQPLLPPNNNKLHHNNNNKFIPIIHDNEKTTNTTTKGRTTPEHKKIQNFYMFGPVNENETTTRRTPSNNDNQHQKNKSRTSRGCVDTNNNHATTSTTKTNRLRRRHRTSSTSCSSTVADHLICPISKSLPFDPVHAEDGCLYERDFIELYFQTRRGQGEGMIKSPALGTMMGYQLFPAPHIRNTIEKLIADGTINGSLANEWIEKGLLMIKREELLERALGGQVEAMEEISTNYYFGQNGFLKNYSAAFDWCQRAHRTGKSADASSILGIMYIDGDGCDRNIVQGISILSVAAGKGCPLAAYTLGCAYLKGKHGLPIDLEEAQHLLEIAVVNAKTPDMKQVYQEKLSKLYY